MTDSPPNLVMLAGPNGAGKTTISREVLHRTLGIKHFVNADTIAAGLSAFDPDAAAFAAGRLMLARIRELAGARESFAFESTLASRTFVPFLRRLKAHAYGVHIVYVCLDGPDRAVRRVKRRVRMGGHHVPADTVRRRYSRSIRNFLHLYVPLADTWTVFNNSFTGPAPLVASGGAGTVRVERDRDWKRILEIADEHKSTD